MKSKVIIGLSMPLAALVAIASGVGLLTPDLYSAETKNWQAQSIGQDMVDLFLILPCLVVSALLSLRNNRTATRIWAGVVLYLTYTFVLYCFDVHFNKLFILYCLCLGLAFYAFLYFLVTQYREHEGLFYSKSTASRTVGMYFIAITLIFYFLWLSEIIPSVMHNTIPKSVVDAGLFTNGVQVLDLAILLPAIFISGVLLLRGAQFGYIMAPVLLTFFILMDITIGILAVIMKLRDVESNLSITMIMGVFALISFVLLIWFLKTFKSVTLQ